MWEEAVELVNSLQPTKGNKYIRPEKPDLNVARTILARIGVKTEQLNKLNIIHVTGTKGKGSTCAFCESILRHKGYKTGFLSSPHLFEVRERIRLDGKPMSKQKFAEYCLSCYRALEKYPMEEMPNYFHFLTLMAFKVFVEEKVDVAVIEVGIGGLYDCTNIIPKPTVCGVNHIGLDHTDILGDTIAKIAWNKAGIFKPGTPAVTASQEEEGMQVLVEEARLLGIPLYLSKPLPIPPSSLGIPGKIQVVNASLALQLTNIWLGCHDKDVSSRYILPEPTTTVPVLPLECPPIDLTPTLELGLSKCSWPGRFQTVKLPGITYYLDGAHTVESMREASAFFHDACLKEATTHKGRVVRVLMFTMGGSRKPYELLKELLNFHFDYVLFTPSMASKVRESPIDMKSVVASEEERIEKCFYYKHVWEDIYSKKGVSSCNDTAGNSCDNTAGNSCDNTAGNSCNNVADAKTDNDTNEESVPRPLPPFILPPYPINHVQDTSKTTSYVMPSIQDSLVWVSNNTDARFSYTQAEAAKAGFKFAFNVSASDCIAGGVDSLVINGGGGGVDGGGGVNGGGGGEGVTGSEDLLVQVVCMGSLHLVGGVLSFVHPTLGY